MQVKIDKQMLLKHRFWVLLGVTLPLVLVALFMLITSVSAEIEKKKKSVEAKANALKGTAGASGPNRIEELKKIAEERKRAETKVHAEAFDAQKHLFVWPQVIEEKFDFQKGRFATDVKIMAEPAKDSWPADEDGVFHGKVVTNDSETIVVKGKDQKDVTFHRTAKVKVSKQERKEGEKEPQWASVGVGNFLAISHYTSRYFFDPLTDTEQREFVRPEGYLSQIHSILKIVDPVDAAGAGTVQLGSWLYKPTEMPPAKSKFFIYVADEWKDDAFIFEEAWLAQEDLWIQRELYHVIRAANDSVSKLKGEAVEDKSKPAVFANPYYELKFEWDGDRLFVTAKNQLPRRQKLDVHFRVKFNKSDNTVLSTEKIMIGGEPLDPRGSKLDSLKKEIPLEKGGIQRTGIYEVEQVLNWETAPVKRIEQVAIGLATTDIAHSHRTFPVGSQPYRKEEKKEDEKAPGGAPGAPGQPGGGGPMGQGVPGGGFGQGFGNNKQAEATFGVNGVLKDRYLEVSEQSRRIPVGASLIVDQDHIDRVLTAFNNSKLRFLTTQVLLNRYPDSVRPKLVGAGTKTGETKDSGVPPAVGGPGSFGPPKGGSSQGPKPGPGPMGAGVPGGGVGGPMGAGGPGDGGNQGPSAAGAEEVENNVELVIYGVVTLYERYPKRKVTDAK